MGFLENVASAVWMLWGWSKVNDATWVFKSQDDRDSEEINERLKSQSLQTQESIVAPAIEEEPPKDVNSFLQQFNSSQQWKNITSLQQEKKVEDKMLPMNDYNDFLKEFSSKEELVANSWPYRDKPMENVVQNDLKQKATGIDTKADEILKKIKESITDPVQIQDIDNYWIKAKELLSVSQSKAYDTSISDDRRKIYWDVARAVEDMYVAPNEWALWKARATKDPKILEHYNSVADKMLAITNEELWKVGDDEIKKNFDWVFNRITDRIANETKEASWGQDESIDSKMAVAKYSWLDKEPDSLYKNFKKAYYGLTLWQQLWKQELPWSIEWIKSWWKKELSEMDQTWIANPAVFVWRLLWYIEWAVWEVADFATDKIQDIKESSWIDWLPSKNRFANSIISQRDMRETNDLQWLEKTMYSVWTIAKNIWRQLYQDADDVAWFASTILLWWSIWKVTDIWKIWKVASIAEKSRLARWAISAANSIIEWSLTNTYLNTMAGQEYWDKWVAMDIWFDAAMWWLWGVAVKEFKAIKDFNKSWSEFDNAYKEALKVSWDEVTALKSVKNEYSNMFAFNNDSFDNLLKQADEWKFVPWELTAKIKDSTGMWWMKNTGAVDPKILQEWAVKAEFINNLNKIWNIEDAKKVVKSGYWVNISSISDALKSEEAKVQLYWWDTVKLDSLKNMYVSLKDKQPMIMQQIDSATDMNKLTDILYNDMGGKALADHYTTRYKMKEVSDDISKHYDDIINWSPEMQRTSALALNDMFKRVGLVDKSVKDIVKDEEVLLSPFRAQLKNFFDSDILPKIKESVTKKKIQELSEKLGKTEKYVNQHIESLEWKEKDLENVMQDVVPSTKAKEETVKKEDVILESLAKENNDLEISRFIDESTDNKKYWYINEAIKWGNPEDIRTAIKENMGIDVPESFANWLLKWEDVSLDFITKWHDKNTVESIIWQDLQLKTAEDIAKSDKIKSDMQSIATLKAISLRDVVLEKGQIEKIVSSYYEDMVNDAVLDMMWIKNESIFKNEKLSDLFSRYRDIQEKVMQDLNWVTTAQRIYLQWFKSVWENSREVRPLYRVLDTYEQFLKNLDWIQIFRKDWSELSNLKDKLWAIVQSDFDNQKLSGKWFVVWKWQNIQSVSSVMTTLLTDFDWIQKNALKDFLRSFWEQKFSKDEMLTLNSVFSMLDWYRHDYNRYLVDWMFEWNTLKNSALDDLTKLWNYMGNSNNELWTLYWAMGILKRYTYKWTEKQYWESVLTAFRKMQTSSDKDISKIAWNFLKEIDEKKIVEDMDSMFKNIQSNIEDRYIAGYRENLKQLAWDDLRSLVMRDFSENLDEFKPLLDSWNDIAIKEKISQILDSQKEDVASRFLYNPVDYFVRDINIDNVVDQLVSMHFSWNEKFWKLRGDMWAKWMPTPSVYDNINSEVKIFSDQLINDEYTQLLKKELKSNDDQMFTDRKQFSISIDNLEYVKNKLAWLFSYWTSDQDKIMKRAMANWASTDDSIKYAMSSDLANKIYKEQSDIFQKWVAKIEKEAENDFNTFQSVTKDVTDNILTSDWSAKVDAMFKEWLKDIEPSIEKEAKSEIAKVYNWMNVYWDSIIRKYLESVIWKKETRTQMAEYMKNVYSMFDLTKPDIQRKMNGQLLMSYNEALDKVDYTSIWGETLNIPLVWGIVKAFYPIMRALTKSERGTQLMMKLDLLNRMAKSTKMEMTSNFARFVEAAWLWTIEQWVLKVWDEAFTIWSKVNAWPLSNLYKQVVFNTWNNWLKRNIRRANINESEMNEILIRAKNMYSQPDSYKYAPDFNANDKVNFVSDLAYEFFTKFHEWLADNQWFRNAYWFEKQWYNFTTKKNAWQEYVKKNFEENFFSKLDSKDRKNILRYGLDTLWPTTDNAIESNLIDILWGIWYKKNWDVAKALLHRWYVDYNAIMNMVNIARWWMYKVLFWAWAFPKTVQQTFSNYVKYKGMVNTLWWLDYKWWYMDYLTKYIENFDALSANRASDRVDSTISNFESKVWRGISASMNLWFNTLAVSDMIIRWKVKRWAIAGALQQQWMSLKEFEELWDMVWKVNEHLSVLNDSELKNILPNEYWKEEKILDDISDRVSKWYYVTKKNTDRLDELIERNYDKIPEDMRARLIDLNSTLKSDYARAIIVKDNISVMAKSYISSFFQAGSTEQTVNLASMSAKAQFFLPLFNWATKEFATNVWDLSVDISRIASRYWSIGDMLKSKSFFTDLMTMPSVINIASQVVEFSMWYKNLNKVISATQWENDELDYKSMMLWIVAPFAAAMQIWSPLVQWAKTYGYTKDAWASNTRAAREAGQAIVWWFAQWFAKEWYMWINRGNEMMQTYSAGKKWGLDMSDISNLVGSIMLRKWLASVVRWTVNSTRWLMLDSKWYDVGQAVNLFMYWDYTKWAKKMKEDIERTYVLKDYKNLTWDIIQRASSSIVSPNLWILTERFLETQDKQWTLSLIDASWEYKSSLDEITNTEWYKKWELFKTIVTTLKWDAMKWNDQLKVMSQEEIANEEADFLKKVYDDWKLDLLKNPDQIIDRVATYRSRFSASYAFWVLVEDAATKMAKNMTEWDQKQASAYLKAQFWKSMYAKSSAKTDIEDRKKEIMDDYIKTIYKDAVVYNKNVGVQTTLLAAKNKWQDLTAWAYETAVTLNLFERSLKSQNNYQAWMSEVKNMRSYLIWTYNKDFKNIIDSNPEWFTKWLSSVTDTVEWSNKSGIEKVYTKWGIYRALWDKIKDVFTASPELAKKYKDVWAVIAWDMLQNSNRLTQEESVRQAKDDFWLGTWKWWTWRSWWSFKTPAAHIAENAKSVIKALYPEYKFRNLPWTNATWSIGIPWMRSIPLRRTNIEWPQLKWLNTKPLSVKPLETPWLPVKEWRTVSTRMKWAKWWSYKTYERIIGK